MNIAADVARRICVCDPDGEQKECRLNDVLEYAPSPDFLIIIFHLFLKKI